MMISDSHDLTPDSLTIAPASEAATSTIASSVPAHDDIPLIEIKGATKTYFNGDLQVEVLHGVDLTIYEGEFVAIVGASGSGKSTLMNILGCLDKPTTGSYHFMGRDVSQLSGDELARLRREDFGFIFQSYHLIATATALENVEVPALYAELAVEERHARAIALLDELGIGERYHHRPSQLSGGQQQRVSIARALMNGGRIILADEPTGALDSKSGKDVMRLLADLSARGHTIILITHAAEVAAHANRIIEIRDGDILSDPGSPPLDPHRQRFTPPAPGSGRSAISEVIESAKMALRSLRANIFRAVLTLLGIVIGVGSVIAMLAIGDGSKQQVLDRISVMGTNLLLVRPGAASNQRGNNNNSSLVIADVRAIDEDVPNVLAAIPEQASSATLLYENTDVVTSINGTSSKFPIARKWPLARGTFFTEEDEANLAKVAVLGQTVADSLFGDDEPVGKYVMVNNVLFQIIGVMASKGASPTGQDQDDVVFVPYATSSMRLSGQRFLRNMTIAVDNVDLIDKTQEDVEQLLAERHSTVDFQIRNMASIIEASEEAQNTMTILLGSIAAISLLVGGIGVMNIMLVSVTERTREIGIRMATGARERNIMQQFLIEAVVVSVIGGAIGVVCGLGTAAIISMFDMPIKYSLSPVILAFACAVSTGLIFGYLPAKKAAKLDPVVALSAE